VAASSVLPHDDRGQGDPVILLHGFPLHRGIWKGQIETLAAKNRVIAFDLPGYGQASTFHCPETLDGFTAIFDASAHAIASPPAVLMGHSMGGYLALEQYGAHPERVRALILTSTRSEADSDEQAEKRHETIARLRQDGPGSFSVQTARNLLAPANASNPDLFTTVLQAIRSAPVSSLVATLLTLASRPDFTDFVASIQVPTLVIWGAEDRVIPPERSKALAAAIPGAKGVEIPGAGHLPFLENPAAYNQAVLEFLGKIPELEAQLSASAEETSAEGSASSSEEPEEKDEHEGSGPDAAP
jgi:3-oxoadipate enol-lactonase